MAPQQPPHFLLVTLPAQGHINPTLQFAKRLLRAASGARVTFVTSASAYRTMTKSPSPDGRLAYAAFSDGYDHGYDSATDDHHHYMSQLEEVGSRTLAALARALADEGRPVTCMIYTVILGWVARVARDAGVPSALLWIQSARVFSIYYHYFHGYDRVIRESAVRKNDDPFYSVDLPKLPPVRWDEIPSFLLPTTRFPLLVDAFGVHFKELDGEERPRVLLNTFEALEYDALRSIDGLSLLTVGPMIPSAFFDRRDASDTTFGGDLFKKARDYLGWLVSKPASSVVYISFGSIFVPSRRQVEEIMHGLAESGRPFLWVVRRLPEELDEEEFRRWVREEEQGLVVPWCSQVEVLSHRSIGCFVSHCGWNSTSEALAMGVPMVCFSTWSDQMMNARLVEEAWRTGVRLEVDEGGVFDRRELSRCLEEVLGGGDGAEEMRTNAKKWAALAKEAASERGSSYKNMQEFVDKIREGY